MVMSMGQDVKSTIENQTRMLSPCPRTPNCVSSVETEKSRYVEPLHYVGSTTEAMTRLGNLLESMKNVRIVSSDDHYIHAEFTSPILKFVDDVEFLADEKSQAIQLKSASRVGSYDFGANRNRINHIRALFEEQSSRF